MPQPAEVTAAAERAIALFAAAQERLIAEQAAILALGPEQRARMFRRRARITELLTSIDNEMAAARRGFAAWASDELPAVYQLGASSASKLAPVLGEFTWTNIHRGAVQQIADDMYTEILEATQFVSADAKRWVRDMGRRTTAGAIIEGRTPQQAARDLARHGAKRLSDMGDPLPITSVRYADGSLRTFDDYADMLIRTKTAEAHTTGNLNFSVENGVQRFQVFDGADCDWPTGHGKKGNANDRIVTAKEAFEHPLAHPRCSRSFGPRPDLDPIEGDSVVAELVAVQAANNAAFTATRNRRTPRRARTSGRTPRTPRG